MRRESLNNCFHTRLLKRLAENQLTKSDEAEQFNDSIGDLWKRLEPHVIIRPPNVPEDNHMSPILPIGEVSPSPIPVIIATQATVNVPPVAQIPGWLSCC